MSALRRPMQAAFPLRVRQRPRLVRCESQADVELGIRSTGPLLDVAMLLGLRGMNRLRKTALFMRMCWGPPGAFSRVPPKTSEISKC